jgi:hypothetical protein
MESLSYHLRREGEGLRERIGVRVLIVHVAIVAVFGVLFPLLRGNIFLDPVVTAAYACLGVLFAGPAVAQGFGLERPRTMNEALARILMGVAYGEMMTILILLAGFMTVYTTRRYAFAPDLGALLLAGFLGLTASFAMGAVAAWMTLRVSAASARRVMRVFFLFLLFLFFFRSASLTDLAGEGVLVSLLIAAGALYGLRREVARPGQTSTGQTST